MKKGTVLINANQKGGVGKTTSTTEEAMVATLPNKQFNNKVLIIDWDMQGNVTSLMGKTFDKDFPKTIYSCIVDNDLKSGIVELTPNLHMIAGGRDMSNYNDFLEIEYPYTRKDIDHIKEVKKKRTFHFKNLLSEIKHDYDYIWIDVGPSTDIKVDNAMVSADYFIITQETKTYSFEGSIDIIQIYIQTLIDDFGDDFTGEVLGLLPFLLQPKRDWHENTVQSTKDEFDENFTFSTIVNNQTRFEGYPEYGVSVIDYHDRKIFAMFEDVFTEIEDRIHLFETEDDIPDNYIYEKNI